MEVTWQRDMRLSENTIYLMTHFPLVPLYRKYTNYIPISLSLTRSPTVELLQICATNVLVFLAARGGETALNVLIRKSISTC